MRVTTKVMQNNSLSNINTNKTLQDKLNTQMATEKKINRPSDDPVVAIRALRLRTNVSQVTQYYEKNAPDAESWLKVTEDALTNVTSVIEDMIEQCTKGANENLTSSDRTTILDALKALRDEVYATGNADYAGRSVFTGYRTESTLKFIADTQKKYSITEDMTTADIDKITHVKTGNLTGINDANFEETAYENIKEAQVVTDDIYRIRLGYSAVDDDVLPTIQIFDNNIGEHGDYAPLTTLTIPGDADNNGTVDDGEVVTVNITTEAVSIDNDPYGEMLKEDSENKIILVKETGELLLGKNVYEELMKQRDNVNTTFDETSILVTYEKTNWEKDDLKPEHYFACTDKSVAAKEIDYNQDYIIPGAPVEKQAIEYDIGMNQTIRVNTTADEVFTHAIGRDVDDLIAVMQNVIDMEETVKRLESMSADAGYNPEQRKTINDQLDAAKKALVYLDETAQKLFEKGISKMQKHLDTANLATTNCGTRSKKLELIENRLMSQKTNFENLESENENVDVTEVAVKLTSAELTYEAALMATGKIMQTSLMNYI